MSQKGFAPIITVILGVVVVLGTVGGYLLFTNQPLPLIQPFLRSEAPPSPSPLDQSREQTTSSTSQPSPTPKESTSPAETCYYEKVWCKKAPCEPVLRCSDQNTIVLIAKEDLAQQLNT